MIRLAEIIREGLRIKRARREETRRVEVREEKPKVEPEVAVMPQPEIKVAPPPAAPPVEAVPEAKEEVEVESPIPLIEKEIEALDLTVDEDNKVYRFGDLATLDFKELEGCNPVMAATKIKEAVKETLLKKYEIKPDELEEKLDELKKKFRTFGTHCYIRVLKQKM